MTNPIKTVAILTGTLFSTGCASSTPDGLNPRNKLHCAVALGITGQNAERENAVSDERRAFFVANSWYAQRLSDSTMESPEAKRVLAIARNSASDARSVAKACIERAEDEAGFNGFRRRVGAIYDEADAARR